MKTTRAAAMAKSQKENGAGGKRKCAVPTFLHDSRTWKRQLEGLRAVQQFNRKPMQHPYGAGRGRCRLGWRILKELNG
jgi:hypothetical protein